MIVVSDTTLIISLLKCHRLEILKELFKEIVIPETVYNELTSNDKFPEEAAAIQHIIVNTSERFESKKLALVSIEKEVVRKGVLLYEA